MRILHALRPFAILACVLAVSGAHAAPTKLDLADIVGGGDGTGTGANAGVDVTDGSTTTSQTGPITAPTNTFVAAANPLIDGVVIPDGGAGGSASIPISSTGLTVSGVSDSTEPTAHTWDHVWNGTNFNTTTTWVGDILGLHANKGVTFDLQAIGAAHGGLLPDAFASSAITGTSASAQVDFYAYVDGVLVNTVSLSGADDFGPGFSGQIPGDARFLTLVTSSDGLSSGDWSALLNPTLDMVRPLVLGQIDDFDTNLDSWDRGHRIVAAGNGYLRIPGPEGVHATTFNTNEHWAGDYVATGVGRIRVDLRNEGPDPLNVHLAFGTTLAPSQGGLWLATANPVVLPSGSGWGTYDIPIGAGDLVAVLGAATWASVMPNVQTLRIVHNTVPDARGALTNSFLNIDNVEALPPPPKLPALGPTGLALLAGGLLIVALAVSRRRVSA